MIEEELKAIEARANAATPGQWKPLLTGRNMTGVHADCGDCYVLIYHASFDPSCLQDTHDRQLRDADFIAHARTDVPTLIAEVRRFRRERDYFESENATIQIERDRMIRERDHMIRRLCDERDHWQVQVQRLAKHEREAFMAGRQVTTTETGGRFTFADFDDWLANRNQERA